MGKGARNRTIRKEAREVKLDHASDPRTTKQIARCIRRHGSPVGGTHRDRSGLWRDSAGGLMTTIKSKIRRK
jgi:hypothetical protein